MAHIARCGIEGCHEHAVGVCSRCFQIVCGTHSTINEVCFECVLGMNSLPAEPGAADAPAIIWWTA